MHRTLIEERNWLTEKQFLGSLSFCMMLPGPEAMQLATYSGWRLRGVSGGMIAGSLFVLPGAIIISALVALYAAYGALPLVQAAFLSARQTKTPHSMSVQAVAATHISMTLRFRKE